jgi:hypothetical protein
MKLDLTTHVSVHYCCGLARDVAPERSSLFERCGKDHSTLSQCNFSSIVYNRDLIHVLSLNSLLSVL